MDFEASPVNMGIESVDELVMGLPKTESQDKAVSKSNDQLLKEYKLNYNGLTANQVGLVDKAFYEVLDKRNLLLYLPSKSKFGDPKTYLETHYSTVDLGLVKKHDPGLYLLLFDTSLQLD